MFEKNIEFLTHEDYLNGITKEDYPTPIKNNIPQWYKNLKYDIDDKTIKGCVPFLDTLTSGYLLKIPQDMKLSHNVINPKDNLPDSFQTNSLTFKEHITSKLINLNCVAEYHPKEQLGKECPFHEKNKDMSYHKILNPWIIKTPPGYSCLFVPPLNNTDDRFSIIPGIVDTDSYHSEVNFPIIINGDKYPTLETVIKKGTPYVQVIPFKRDNWKMSVKKISQKEVVTKRIFKDLVFMHYYRTKFWKRKTWK